MFRTSRMVFIFWSGGDFSKNVFYFGLQLLCSFSLENACPYILTNINNIIQEYIFLMHDKFLYTWEVGLLYESPVKMMGQVKLLQIWDLIRA